MFRSKSETQSSPVTALQPDAEDQVRVRPVNEVSPPLPPVGSGSPGSPSKPEFSSAGYSFCHHFKKQKKEKGH